MSTELTRKYAPGEVLCREGQMGREAYLIQSGRVRVTRRQGNEDVVLAELGSNEIVGEFSIIDHEPRSATVTAIIETEVVALSSGRLSILFERSPDVAATIVKLLVHKLRQANQRKTGGISPTDWIFWRRTMYLLLLLAAVGNNEHDELLLPDVETRKNLSIGLGVTWEEINQIVERLIEATLLKRQTSGPSEKFLVMRMSEINMMFNYIDQTYKPGSAEPKPSLEENTRAVAEALLTLCRKHYGDLSMALSTFRRNTLVDFIAGSTIFQGSSEGMRKRLIGNALADLQKLGFLKLIEEKDDVVSLNLTSLAELVEADLALIGCRECYTTLSQSWSPLPKITT